VHNFGIQILRVLGGLSFIFSGVQIMVNRDCSSVSWGGYRFITVTCFSNTAAGGIPEGFAAELSTLGGMLLKFMGIKRRKR